MGIRNQPIENISIGYGHHLLWNRNDFYSSTTTQKLDEYLLSKDFNAKLNYCIPKFHSTFSLLFKQRGSRPAYAYDKTSKTYFATKTKVIDNLDLFYLLSLWKDRIEIKMAVKIFLTKRILKNKYSRQDQHITVHYSYMDEHFNVVYQLI